MQAVQPAMLDGERSDAYVRRTGFYPPHWNADRCRVQDTEIQKREHLTTMGVTAKDRASGRAYLRRWGQ